MIAETLGANTINLETGSRKVKDVRKDLLEKFPKLENMSFKIVSNLNLVEDEVILSSNDDIALLPPFAGG